VPDIRREPDTASYPATHAERTVGAHTNDPQGPMADMSQHSRTIAQRTHACLWARSLREAQASTNALITPSTFTYVRPCGSRQQPSATNTITASGTQCQPFPNMWGWWHCCSAASISKPSLAHAPISLSAHACLDKGPPPDKTQHRQRKQCRPCPQHVRMAALLPSC
jgi:hypothetical protein